MHYNKLLSIALFTLLTSIINITFAANDNTSLSRFNPKRATIDFQIGAFTASQGEAQHININSLIGDDFSVSHLQGQNILIGLGYFIPGQTTAHAKVLYGIDAFYLAPTIVTGYVTQENQPSPGLSYRYALTNYPIYFDAKTIFNNSNPRYNVTFDAGLGPNIIDAGNFSEGAIANGLPDNIFSPNTSTVFSATAGIGILIHHVLGHLPLECSYRFFYLGKGHLNKNNDEVLDTLKTGTNYANALMVSTLF